jgi:sporulation protein YlmC with PRC-barrel domain
MIKFINQLIGAKVILFQERAVIGQVTRVLIDPDDGVFIGLAVAPVHEKQETYIPTTEIKGFGRGLVIVEDLRSLSEAGDVIRIKKVLDDEPEIVGASVFDEGGIRLGRVGDATVDVRIGVLKKLYVNPPLLAGILGNQRIIDAKQIVKIEKKRITVRDTKVRKKNISLSLEIPATD